MAKGGFVMVLTAAQIRAACVKYAADRTVDPTAQVFTANAVPDDMQVPVVVTPKRVRKPKATA